VTITVARAGNSFKSRNPEADPDEGGNHVPLVAPIGIRVVPNPNEGSFVITKEPKFKIVDCRVTSSTGQQTAIQFIDRGDRLDCSFTHRMAGGLFIIHLQFEDGSRQEIKMILEP